MMPDDDNNLFQSIMGDVQPLAQDKHRPHRTPPKIKKQQDRNRFDTPVEAPIFDYDIMDQSRWVDGNETVQFQRPGINPKTLKRLRTGKLNSGATIDLHHYSGGEAILATDEFIQQSVQIGVRVITIIHGKGYKSQHNKPIIKNLLIEHLRNNLFVLAYHSTQPREGGTGALKILLRAAPKVTS